VCKVCIWKEGPWYKATDLKYFAILPILFLKNCMRPLLEESKIYLISFMVNLLIVLIKMLLSIIQLYS
jgi:hypothetical protein